MGLGAEQRPHHHLLPKMSQASCGVWREDSGLLSRPYSKRRPSSREDWGVSWVFLSPRVARESWGLRSSHRRAEETSPRRVSGT